MSFGSNVTPKRFGAGKPAKPIELRDYMASLKAGKPVGELAVEPDPEPVPDIPIVWNDITLNDCYRCGHRGNNPVPGCGCCANEHNGEPADPED